MTSSSFSLLCRCRSADAQPHPCGPDRATEVAVMAEVAERLELGERRRLRSTVPEGSHPFQCLDIEGMGRGG